MIVQCGILAYVKDMDHEVAPDIAMDLMGKAIDAAPRLLAKLSAEKAAKEFVESIEPNGEPALPK